MIAINQQIYYINRCNSETTNNCQTIYMKFNLYTYNLNKKYMTTARELDKHEV